MRYHLVALVLASLLLPASLRSTNAEFLGISLIQLIANPEKFAGKSVTVEGYLRMEHQPQHAPLAILYLHEEDANNLLGWNAVQVQPSEGMQREEEKLDRMYVELTGSVHVVQAQGGATQPTIADVQRCVPLSDPSRPRGLKDDKNKPSLRRP